MERIIYIGMDVHSTSYSLCALEPVFGQENKFFFETKVTAEPSNIIKYIDDIESCFANDECTFVTGYEAGCLGFSLYNYLKGRGIDCKILAPTKMSEEKGGKKVKTDKRDARTIAQNLAYGTYSAVFVPTEEDLAVRDYIRMRNDHKAAVKRIKQQINALCMRHGYIYQRTKWTAEHLKYIKGLTLSPLYREILQEYLATMEQLNNKIKAFDVRIEELSKTKRYKDNVGKLACFTGITRSRALAIIAEIGDFRRFLKPLNFAAYLGLVPGEKSSGKKQKRIAITKAGNSHIRKELIEAAQSICRGLPGYKSRALLARQQGNDTTVINYADKASARLRRRYYKLERCGKKHNVAVTAVARELSCFICGMMNGLTEVQIKKA